MNQIGKNDKKPNFGHDFGPTDPNLGSQFIFLRVLPLRYFPSYHPMKFKGKLINQTWENGIGPTLWSKTPETFK